MKWEYRFEGIPLIGDDPETFKRLFKLVMKNFRESGQQGWELVSVDNGIAYFKRPLEEIPPAIVVIYTDRAQQAQEIADEINRHLRMRGDD